MAYRKFDEATGTHVWCTADGTPTPPPAWNRELSAGPAAPPPPARLTMEQARQQFDAEVRSIMATTRLSRRRAVALARVRKPDLHAAAHLALAARQAGEVSDADRQALGRGWAAAVRAELPNCGGDPVQARSLAARKHPGLRAALVSASANG